MPIYEFGAFHLNAGERLLQRDGQAVSLKPKILDLLLFLVQNSGCVLTKDAIMKAVWADSFVEESNVYVSVSALRKILEADTKGRVFIENVPKRGYRLVAEVTVREPNARAVKSHDQHTNGAAKTALAVLPFKYIGAGEEDEYLGLGLTDALITKLCNVRQVIVRPTSAVRKYQEAVDPLAAGRELRVGAVLDGSIRRAGQRLRVTVQMVNIADGAALWAGQFDEQFTDIFAVEDSISTQVIKALMLQLTREEQARLVKHHTENPEAYQLYLQGRYCNEKRTAESLKKAVEYFQRAIEIDPNYALAYCGLADCYIYGSGYNVFPPKEYLSQAGEAALKALQLDDSLAEAHSALGHYGVYIWDWAGAEREYKRAIELNSNHIVTHRRYASYLVAMARFDEAEAESRKGMELNPLSSRANYNLGYTFYFARQYDRAIEHLSRMLELEPDLRALYAILLGLAYEQKGMHDEAIAEYNKALSLQTMEFEILSYIGYSYATSGRINEARKVLDELLEASQQHYVEPYFIALLYTALGEKDEAFAWLEKGYEEHILTMGELKVDPMFDSLRDDPRFTDLLQRMGFLTNNERGSDTRDF
ncbi:MAG: winged helix-turn-helix domain-containing protein [Acidobacteria bacterium]|nr:winged helix-turn-helix domain-containing protein [Acidobacteriota bacterium]